MNSGLQAHRQVWEALPWILNGSASEAEAQAAQAHLRECADCREAWAFEQRLHEAIAQSQIRPMDPEPGWQRLAERLDSADTGSSALRWLRRSTVHQVRWLAAAVIIEALALGAIVSSSWISRPPLELASLYRTQSSPQAAHAAATIRVVLAPEMTLDQFRGLLREAHLQVVGGPGEAGAWSLAPAEDAGVMATEAALRELRGSPQVRFAEPIIGAAAPPSR